MYVRIRNLKFQPEDEGREGGGGYTCANTLRYDTILPWGKARAGGLECFFFSATRYATTTWNASTRRRMGKRTGENKTEQMKNKGYPRTPYRHSSTTTM